MFTYSDANTPLSQSECANYLSYFININTGNPQSFMSITWMSYDANFAQTNRKFKVQGVFVMMFVG